jgi:DNA primase
VDLFHSAGRNTREYWYKRLLTDDTIDRYRLGNFEDWNLIPIYDDGLFYNFQCRRDTPDKRIRFWYKDRDFKPVLFNKEVLPFIESVWIVEGMVDCLLLNQLGLPSVCSINGADTWNPGWIRHFTKMKNVVYIADNDAGGIVGAKRVSDSLGSSRVRIMRFKDKGEKYGSLNFFQDGGTVEEFKQIIKDNFVYGFDKGAI